MKQNVETNFFYFENQERSNNLLELHSNILQGFASSDREEVERLEKFDQLPLRKLDSSKFRKVIFQSQRWAAIFAIAASVGLILVLNQSNEYTIKGSSNVAFIREHAGVRSIFIESEYLETADKANAEILAPENSIAFMAVFSRDGRLLTHTDYVEQNVLKLSAGKKAHFPIAVELDEESDGETMIVVVCEERQFVKAFTDVGKFVGEFFQNAWIDNQIESRAPFCSVEKAKLRQ